MALYAGQTAFTIQPGTEIVTTPEGLTSITVKWRGQTSTRSAFEGSYPRGTVCPISGHTTLTSIAAPRFAEEGAYCYAYVVFQGPPDGDGTVESDLDINFTTENRTAPLPIGPDGAAVSVSFLSPTVTASYVAGSKPASFRFAGLLDGDPTIVGKYRVPPAALEAADYTIVAESKWLERRNTGGIWRVTEQHANIIEAGPGD